VVSLGVGATAVATDLTLMATSLAVSELVKMPPKQFAWISVAGGVGLVTGLSVANLAADKVNPKLGIAAGSALGLVVGTVATSFFDWEQPAGAAVGITDEGGGAAWAPWLPEVTMWFPSVAVTPAGDPDGLSGISGTQMLVQVSGWLK